jgi:carbonic anhydrase
MTTRSGHLFSLDQLLGSREIMIINHTDCGMLRFTDSEMEDRLRKETGRAPIAPARFYSFTDAEENTREQIQKARSHPWISQDVPIRGFVYDVDTGRLREVFPNDEKPLVRNGHRRLDACCARSPGG